MKFSCELSAVKQNDLKQLLIKSNTKRQKILGWVLYLICSLNVVQ